MSRGELAAHQIERPDLYEHKDVSPRAVIIFFIALGIGVLLVLVFVYAMYQVGARWRAAAGPFPTVKAEQVPPEPRLQYAPRIDLDALRAHEDAILDTYGWVDQKAGVVRIPIDRAMALLAQRRLPVRSGSGPVPTVPDTGPESGGPQTGAPTPRYKPAPLPVVPSAPLRGSPQVAPGPALLARPEAVPTGGSGGGAMGTGSAPQPDVAYPLPPRPSGPAAPGAAPPGASPQPANPGAAPTQPLPPPSTSQTGGSPR